MLTNVFEHNYILTTQRETPKNIVVVGAGGTGGYLIPHLARQVALQNQLREVEGLAPHIITIVEGDEVELKNLTRQNFIERDVSKNKGEVLAERYGSAFGTTINFVAEYLQNAEQLRTIFRQIENTANQYMMPVLVDCVDNNKTRVIMTEAAKYIGHSESRDVFYISSGNEEWNGQVVCSFLPGDYSRNRWKIGNQDSGEARPIRFRTPLLGEMYPEVMNAEDKLPTELSCAERAVSAPQQILTNMMAANFIFTFLNTILTANGNENEGLEHFAVTFDAKSSVVRTYFNKKSEIEAFIR